MLKNYLLVFFISMVPIVELRGAIPIGLGLGLPALPTYFLCVLGNMLPVPFIYLFARLDRHAGGVHPGHEVQGCAGGLHGWRIAGRDHYGSGQCGPVGCVERSVCRGLMAQTCRRFVVEIAHSISAPSVLEWTRCV